MRIDKSGNVGIGTTSPDSIKLDVEDDIEIGTGTTGCVRDADNTTLVGTCVSDQRLKKNIIAFSSGTLEKLVALRPVTFEWRNDEYSWINGQVGINYGLIAQEVEAIFPEMVHTDNRGYKRVSYDIGLSMRMLQGIKELDLKIDDYEERIAALEGSSLTGSGSSSMGGAIGWVLDGLSALGVEIKQGMVKLANLTVDTLSSHQIYTKTIETEELCVGDSTGAKTCITKTELDALLQKNGVNNSNSSSVLNNIKTPISNNDIEEQEGVVSSPKNTENNSEILNSNLETISNNENSNVETATKEIVPETIPTEETTTETPAE
jgi:hypothetical protein